MLDELADARLAIPLPPARHVPRHRLLTALENATDVPLVLLSAGPGTGKTVLLAEWARRRRGHVAWLSPASDDDEPSRFRSLLTAALRTSPDPGPPQPGPSQPVPPQPVPPQSRVIDFVHWLRGQLPGGPAPLVLVIDDAHILTDPRIIDLLDKLVCYGHPKLHLVLAARHDPPLPLHRYRLAGQMRELRMPDLAMTPGEMGDVLAAHQLTLPAHALSTLAARTEGWAAGVRLAAMRMERAPAPARLVDELSFDHGGIGEYFMAEVLSGLPEQVRRLLIETSFLDEVTAPLAEAITGRSGAGEMLSELARRNCFVFALDPAGTRFRYHRLFAEVLRCLPRRGREQFMPELAGRAAACFERDGDMDRALHWAAVAGDPHQVAALLVRGGLSHAFAHHHAVAGVDLGDVLAELANQPPDDTTRQTAALVELMMGMRSGEVGAVDHAAVRLTRPPSAAGLRAAVLLAQANAHFWGEGQDDVEDLLSQALAEARRCGLIHVQAEVLGMMACVDSYRSRPRRAQDAALAAHRLLRHHPGLRTPTALRLAMAVRLFQQADLAAAARVLRHVSGPTAVGAHPGLAEACLLWHATVLTHSGRPHEARTVLGAGPFESAETLLQVHRDLVLGEIETRLGRPREALRRFERHPKGRLAVVVDVARARAYLALDDLESTRQSIRAVLSATRPRLSRYALVESMLMDASIANRTRDTGRALEMITNALDVAHGEVALPFVEARPEFGDLLARHPALADRWPRSPGDPGGAVTAVPQPGTADVPVQLTPREQAVLSYLATSMTAAEIAAELYLSVNTVKTHLAAIYRKLGTGRRREAVRRARELELL
jgi:LuxR family maltose regulon positive regulatory protein